MWLSNKETVINWITSSKDKSWGKLAFAAFDMIIDTLPEGE